MAQYDISFVVNTAPSGVSFQEHSIKLAKGELLVGTATTPTVQAAAQNGKVLVYDDTQATGFAAVARNVFDDLIIEYASIRNNTVPNCHMYIGDDGLIEIVASSVSSGDGEIVIQGQRTDLLAQDLYFPSIGGTGDYLTIDANGKVTRTALSSGGSNWTVTGSDIWRNSRIGVKNSSPSYDVDVTGNSRFTTGVYTTKVYGSSDTDTYMDFVSADQLRFVVGGVEMLRIVESTYDRIGVKQASPAYDFDVTGDIRATGDILSNSDVRLKRNIKPLTPVLDKVKQLKPRSFDWIANDKADVGLIAQEVEMVFPELVRTDDNGFKTINYSKLTVFLLKALQEII